MSIAIAILLGSCAAAPLFDLSGPVCGLELQSLECRCSECFRWDPVPGAEWYEVSRRDPDASSAIVGRGGGPNHARDPAGTPPLELYCVAWDRHTPREGLSYVYQVRACKGTPATEVCSPWSGEADPDGFLLYVGAPYTCYRMGKLFPCP